MKYNGRFKVSYETPLFHVNKSNGTVTCILNSWVKTPFILYDGWLDSEDYPKVPSHEVKGLGIAKCKEGDVFNEERGKRIALARAENDCYIKAMRYLSEQAQCMNTLMENISEFTDHAYSVCAHNDEYIDALSFEAHPNYVKEVKDINRGVVVTRK